MILSRYKQYNRIVGKKCALETGFDRKTTIKLKKAYTTRIRGASLGRAEFIVSEIRGEDEILLSSLY